MPHFGAIDGLRAWMAWTVVASHIYQLAMPNAGGAFWLKLDLGGHAVNTFIIISGFVITHLLIERPNGYAAYIIPRFMRLFPAFAVCWVIGVVTYAVAARWGNAEWFDRQFDRESYASMVEYAGVHTIAHLTMLHGAIPNPVLPLSQYAFLPPGWSVSLEWQFYLVAPCVIWFSRNGTRATMLCAIVVLFSLAYHFAMKGYWERPSVLIGASKFFLVGIGCRFAVPKLAGSVRYVTAVALGIGYTALWLGGPSLAIWLIVLVFMLRTDRPNEGVDRLFVAFMRHVLESGPVRLLAERSYSTYLLHWSVIMLIGTVASSWEIMPGPQLLAASLLAVPLTLMLQEPIYRLIEVPGRALGKRWARQFGRRPVAEAVVR